MASCTVERPDAPAPAPPPAAPRNPRYQTLDLWRGLACLMIVVLHAAHRAGPAGDAAGAFGRGLDALLARLYVGVPLFFVISGYCIAATSDATRRRPRAPARFFYRRFRRIFPPYWCLALLSLGLVVALGAAGRADLVSDEYGYIPAPSALGWSQYLGNVTLTETWRPHLLGGPELKIVGPAWTLCYEEQFYAVCGLLLVLAPRRFFAGVGAVTLLTALVVPVAVLRPDLLPVRGFFFDGYWLMFAKGVAVYHVLNYARSRAAGAGLLALVLAALAALRRAWPALAADPVMSVRAAELTWSTAFSLLLLLLHPWDRRTAESRLLRPLAVCGRMCYSLYLVHWPVCVVLTNAFYHGGVRGFWPTLLVTAPVAVAASVALSWLFHLAVERRFLNGPPPAGKRSPRLAPRSVLQPLQPGTPAAVP